MKKPTTIQERARALAQEMVLAGGLRGSQWDGLTALLVTFALSEISLVTVRPPSTNAVDPHAADPGKPTSRDVNS